MFNKRSAQRRKRAYNHLKNSAQERHRAEKHSNHTNVTNPMFNVCFLRCINPSGTRQPQSTANVTMPIHLFAFYIRAGSARPLKQTTIRSPQPIQSILPWPPSGCPGPVPLALMGRSEGPASLAHGNAFSVFFDKRRLFSTSFVF